MMTEFQQEFEETLISSEDHHHYHHDHHHYHHPAEDTRKSLSNGLQSLPSDFSDVQPRSYDPEYISAISNKMQIPDRLSVDGLQDSTNEPRLDPPHQQHTGYHDMHVPDRILVAGEDKHIGLKDSFRTLDFEPPTQQEMGYVGLITPPRTLTLEERFPMVEDLEVNKSNLNNSHRSHAAPVINSLAPVPFSPGVSPNDSLLINEEDETTVTRMQVSKLTRRLAVLEQDSNRRSQRELVVYPVVFGYFILKIFWWFFRSK